MRALLVEPKSPKSWGKNNQHVGLLRIAHWLSARGNSVEYIRAPQVPDNSPDEIYITSMFTYNYKEVAEAISQYGFLYPNAKIYLGGVYATIAPDHAAKLGAEVISGQHPEAKDYPPDPSVLPYKQDFAYLFTSYGCNYACTYCATHLLFGKGMRQVAPEVVVDEIKYLNGRGFKNIWFGDDNLLYNAGGHINLICEEILRQGIKVDISVPGGMAAKEYTPETAGLMKRAGVKKVSFAIESTSGAVRQKMGRAKHAGEEDLIQAVEIAAGLGYKRNDIGVFFIIGLPYQTLTDMLDTLLLLIRLGVWAHPHRFTPIPNTVEWKRMGLEAWDFADLHYKKFVAPDQDNFSHEDLNAIYKIARFFNIGSRYTSGYNWLSGSRVNNLFRAQLQEAP